MIKAGKARKSARTRLILPITLPHAASQIQELAVRNPCGAAHCAAVSLLCMPYVSRLRISVISINNHFGDSADGTLQPQVTDG